MPYYLDATKVPKVGVGSGNNVVQKRDEQEARMQRRAKRFEEARYQVLLAPRTSMPTIRRCQQPFGSLNVTNSP